MPQSKVATIWKRLKSVFDLTSFASDTNQSPSAGMSGRRWWTPGTDLNWDAMAGDLWEIPGMAACYHWITRNWLQAPLTVERLKGEEWTLVPDHRLISLLTQPNEEYDGTVLLQGVILSWIFNGNAYIGIESGVASLPRSLWYIPHFMIRPRRDRETGLLYYEYNNGGRIRRLQPEEVIHLRMGIDPRNPLLGLGVMACAAREGYVLQQDSNYRAKSMKNTGVLSGIVSPELRDGQDLANLDFNPVDFLAKFRQKLTGDRAGEPVVWNLPLKFQKVGLTPQELLMETFADRPESLTCALLGVPPQVVGLHVGRLSKTYNNMKEARESAWEECVIPNQNLVANQLGKRLLPFTSTQSGIERLVFSIQNVRPLQPDFDAIHKRERDNWLANLITREQFKLATNQVPSPEDVGVYYKDTLPSTGNGANDAKVGERIN